MSDQPENNASAGSGPDENPESGAARPARPGRRRKLALGIVFVLFLSAAAAIGGYWVVSLPPGMGILAGLRSAGVPVPQAMIEMIEPSSGPSAGVPPVPASQTTGNGRSAVLPAGGVLPVEAFEDDLARTGEQIAELERLLTDANSKLGEQADAIIGLRDEIQGLSDHLGQLEESRHADAGALREALDTARAARRKAEHARTIVESAGAGEDGRLELVEEGVQALANSHRRSRNMIATLNDRIEEVASDLDLLSYYGAGRSPAAPAGSTVTTTASSPWQSNYYSAADAPAAEPRVAPESLVQGQYRVGDWIAGWGVVTAIRKTPDGDHLTTPAGNLFAPPAGGQ